MPRPAPASRGWPSVQREFSFATILRAGSHARLCKTALLKSPQGRRHVRPDTLRRHPMQRRHVLQALASGIAGVAAPSLVRAQALEKPKLTVAVGGKNLLYYLPLTIAETQGYFKQEGLDITIADFAGGSRALQALVGGSR